MRARIQTLLSFLLIAAGALFLFLGARDYFSARLGQSEAARDFEQGRGGKVDKAVRRGLISPAV